MLFKVPSDGSEVDPQTSRKLFEEEAVPVLGLLADRYHVQPGTPYNIDEDVRLVCKYLEAYESGAINALHSEGESVYTCRYMVH